jgi:hypothetical protein
VAVVHADRLNSGTEVNEVQPKNIFAPAVHADRLNSGTLANE